MKPELESNRCGNIVKALIAFLLVTASLSLQAQSNVISGNIQSFNLAGRTNIPVQLSIMTPARRVINGVWVSSDPVVAVSDAGGNFSFTNVLWGSYRLTARDSVGSYLNITVLTNTTGNWNVASLATNSAALLPIKWTFDSTIVTFDQQ